LPSGGAPFGIFGGLTERERASLVRTGQVEADGDVWLFDGGDVVVVEGSRPMLGPGEARVLLESLRAPGRRVPVALGA
jgi:hypothetical protein